LKHYDLLVIRAQQRGWTKKIAPCYVERHHVIPKCIGGTNKISNIVCLTPEEHYVAHQLLYKIYKDTEYGVRLLFSANMMSGDKYNTRKNCNKSYGWIKRLCSEEISKMNKNKTISVAQRAAISESNRTRIISDETREKHADAMKGNTYGCKPRSDETKHNISVGKKGKPSPLKGKPSGKKGISSNRKDYLHSLDTKDKIKNSCKNQERVECPHCGKIGTKGNMKRWHFENCKYKE
jgi:hypothetical protein